MSIFFNWQLNERWNIQCPSVQFTIEYIMNCPMITECSMKRLKSNCTMDNWMYNEMPYVYLFSWQLNVQWNIQYPSVQLRTECTMKCPMSICTIDNWMYNVMPYAHLYNWQLNVHWKSLCPSVQLTSEYTMEYPMSICTFDNSMYNKMPYVHLYNWQLNVQWNAQIHLCNWQLNVQWNTLCSSVKLIIEYTMKCPMSICSFDNWMYSETSVAPLYCW